MGSAIKYCEKCGGRIDPADFENGKAITYRNELYCGNCKIDILPLIEKDPEYRRGARPASSRTSGLHDAASARPSSVRMRPPGAPSSVYRRPSSGLHPVPPTSRRSSSARAPRERSGGKATLVIGLSVLTVVLLLVVVLAIALSSGSPPAVGGENGASAPVDATPPKKEVPPKDRWEIAFAKAEEDAAKIRKEVDDPVKRMDPIAAERAIFDLWEKVAFDLKGTAREKAAEERRLSAEQRIDQRARTFFERTRQQVDAAIQSNNYDLALSAWKQRFPEALLYSAEWRSKIDEEVKAVEKAREDWLARKPDPEPGPEPGPGPGPLPVSSSGRPIPDQSWRQMQLPPNPPLIRAEGDAWILDATSAPDPLRITAWQSFPGGSLKLDLRLDSGSMRVEGPGGHQLELSGPTFATGSWIEVTVRYEATSVKAWIGDTPCTISQPTRAAGTGALVLVVPKGTALRVRALWLNVEGGFEIAPSAKGEHIIFDGTGLGMFQQFGGGTFRAEAGSLFCDNPSDPQGGLFAGKDDWGDARLSFEIRGLEGHETITFAFNLVAAAGGQMNGDPGEIKGTYFTDPNAWTRVEIDVVGSAIVVRVAGQSVSRVDRSQKRGPFGIIFPQGTNCYLRNVRIVLE